MRVFTDGACSNNGRPTAKAGFAAWFPEHPELSRKGRVPDDQSQTNQRAELSGIREAFVILDEKGHYDEDVVIYTDSDYSINCLTKWISGWMKKGWKTSEGKDVLHQDLLKDVYSRLSKFKSHRFVHVRAHTGKEDDLSKNNDIVDRMARATIDDTVSLTPPPAEDALFPGCPLRLLGSPIPQSLVLQWIRNHMSELDADIVDKHLMKAFVEICKVRDVNLTKQTIAKTTMLRAERGHLQISHLLIEKLDT